MKNWDVAVVGGGPTGLHAARLLAGRGLEVAVLDKKSAIGNDILCTGIVGSEIFSEFGIPDSSVTRSIQSVEAVAASGNRISYRHPRVFANIVDRKKFDRSLAEEARKAGAHVLPGTRVTDVGVESGGVRLSLRNEHADTDSLTARIALLATGVDHGLSKKLGLGYPKKFLWGAQVDMDVASAASPTLFFGKDIAPGGFGWAVPSSPGKAMVGLITDSDPRAGFKRLVARHFPGTAGLPAPVTLGIKPIAQGLISRSFGDRLLVLGEAAGQVKTTTGGGIYYGLLCAAFAAAVVAESCRKDDFRPAVLADYERRWKRALKKEIRIGYYARKLFSRMSEAQIERVFAIAQSDGILPLIQEKGNFDWQSGLILDIFKKASLFEVLREVSKKSGFWKRDASNWTGSHP